MFKDTVLVPIEGVMNGKKGVYWLTGNLQGGYWMADISITPADIGNTAAVFSGSNALTYGGDGVEPFDGSQWAGPPPTDSVDTRNQMLANNPGAVMVVGHLQGAGPFYYGVFIPYE